MSKQKKIRITPSQLARASGEKPAKVRPRQSGMEEHHERVVLALLNFLQARRVQTYEGGWNADSSEGMMLPKGKVISLPDRLNILRHTLDTDARRMRSLRSELEGAKHELRNYEEKLLAAETVIVDTWRSEDLDLLDTYMDELCPEDSKDSDNE